jgi:hypothetical protein
MQYACSRGDPARVRAARGSDCYAKSRFLEAIAIDRFNVIRAINTPLWVSQMLV